MLVVPLARPGMESKTGSAHLAHAQQLPQIQPRRRRCSQNLELRFPFSRICTRTDRLRYIRP